MQAPFYPLLIGTHLHSQSAVDHQPCWMFTRSNLMSVWHFLIFLYCWKYLTTLCQYPLRLWSMLAKEQQSNGNQRAKRSRLVLILLWVYLCFFLCPAHVAKFRMRRANGQKRLDWLFLISPITVKRRWGRRRRHAGTRDGLEGGAWPGREKSRTINQRKMQLCWFTGPL